MRKLLLGSVMACACLAAQQPEPQQSAILTSSELSLGSPAMARLGGRTFVAWTGTDQRLNVMELRFEPRTPQSAPRWVQGGKAILQEYSAFGPALCSDGGMLFLAWTGTDGRLNVARSNDGRSFFEKKTLAETSAAAPGLCLGSETYILSWTSSDGQNRLCVRSMAR